MQAAGKETMGWNWLRERAWAETVRRKGVVRRVRRVEESILAVRVVVCGERGGGRGGVELRFGWKSWCFLSFDVKVDIVVFGMKTQARSRDRSECGWML